VYKIIYYNSFSTILKVTKLIIADITNIIAVIPTVVQLITLNNARITPITLMVKKENIEIEL